MADSAAWLVDCVFPDVPVRQWVLSLPHRVRWACAFDHRTTLEAALQQLDRQQVVSAIGQISAFASEVQALVTASILTIQQGEPLYDGAALLVSMLS